MYESRREKTAFVGLISSVFVCVCVWLKIVIYLHSVFKPIKTDTDLPVVSVAEQVDAQTQTDP